MKILKFEFLAQKSISGKNQPSHLVRHIRIDTPRHLDHIGVVANSEPFIGFWRVIDILKKGANLYAHPECGAPWPEDVLLAFRAATLASGGSMRRRTRRSRWLDRRAVETR